MTITVKKTTAEAKASETGDLFKDAFDVEEAVEESGAAENQSVRPTLRDNMRNTYADTRCGRDPSFRNKVCCGFIFIVFLTAAILVGMSLKRVSTTEYGISYSKYSKQLSDASNSGGLFVGPPGFRFIKFPSLYITADLPESTCVSKDGLRVKYLVTFQYQMPEKWLLPAILKYRDFEGWVRVVEFAGNSAVQHACSLFSISNFQNKRGVIQSKMEERLGLKLEGVDGTGSDGVFAKAISLQLKNVDLPNEYRDAVSEKQQAEEDIALAKNQRVQETTKASTELLSAREESKKIDNTAVIEAELLLTEANLKAEEINFTYQTEAEVLTDVRANLNLTTEGVLAYMSNRLYAETPHLKVTAAQPAKLGRESEL